MAGMSLAERQEIPGMKAFRASMIPYANSLIAHVLDQGIIESFWMSMYSLKEGYWFSSQE
jgi:exopolyphosphatase/pppGpp-phosphohydrolase